MTKNNLISDLLELTVQGEKFEEMIFEQIKHLIIREQEHTGIGLFIYFDFASQIEKYRLSKKQTAEMFGNYAQRLQNVELSNSTVNVLADVTVHFSEGLIDYLEIWNKLGDFPKDELVSYDIRKIA